MKILCFTPLRLLIKISHQLHILGNLACHFQPDYNHSIVRYSELRLGRHLGNAGTMGRVFPWQVCVTRRLLFAQTHLPLTATRLCQLQIFWWPM